MAIQTYFQQYSLYHDEALAWLRLNNVAHPTLSNFQFLMNHPGAVITWNTGHWNNSAPYPGAANRTERLILGPINHITIQGRNCPVPRISNDEFFYVDDNTPINAAPANSQDTPFIIRGIATALKDCLRVDRPHFKNRFYSVRFCNQALEIASEA